MLDLIAGAWLRQATILLTPIEVLAKISPIRSMSIVEGFHSYYKALGPRGVAAIIAHRLTGRPREIKAQARGYQPLWLRVRTTDVSIFRDILVRSEYEWNLPFQPHFILDAGANIGMASVFFARKYREARILAVEPEPANFEMLVRNVRAYPNVIPVQAALWSQDGQINIGLPEPILGAAGEWAFVTSEEAKGPKVRAVSIPTLLRESGFPSLDVAKIDIEGAEVELFEDASWAAGVRCVMIELHDRFRKGCSEAVMPAFQNHKVYTRGETTIFCLD